MKKFFHKKAFFIHLTFSIFISFLLTIIIVGIWYPNPWFKVLGGLDLLFKVLAFDIIVGPVCVGLCYKASKKLRANVFDIIVISFAQLIFLTVGFYYVAQSRPVFIVFVKDRFEVVVRSEIEESDLLQAKPPFNAWSITGPVYAGVAEIKDIKTKNEVILSGVDYQYQPRYYQEITDVSGAISQSLSKCSQIRIRESKQMQVFEDSLKKNDIKKDDCLWLPVHHRYGFMVAIMDQKHLTPQFYINIDPL